MKNYLPKREYLWFSPFPPERVREILQDNSEPMNMWKYRKREKFFQGKVNESSFELMKIIRYRNSFNPVITGQWTEKPGGSEIHVKMALHPLVLTVAIVWLCGVGFACLFITGLLLINLFAGNTGEIHFGFIIPYLMLAMAVIFFPRAFKREADKSESELIQLLQVKNDGMNFTD